VAASDQRLVLMREFERPTELSVHQLLAELYEGVDWVLVEGFKDSDLLKIEVWRGAADGYVAKPALYPDDDFIVAIATNTPAQLPQTTLRPVLDLDDPDALVEWLVQHGQRFDYSFDIR